MGGNLKKIVDVSSPLFLLIAVLWLCWGLSRGFWLFMSPANVPNLPVVAPQIQTSNQSSNTNAFAIFTQQQAEVTAQPSIAPSNMNLKGVIVATPYSNSSAVIAINGKLKNYRIGSDVGGYRLTDVTSNSIMLNENIELKLNKAFDLNRDEGKNQAGLQGLASAIPVTAQSVQPTANVHALTPEQKAENDINAIIEEAAEHLEQDPIGYLGSVGILPTSDGYEVTDNVPSDIRAKIGLEAGDKIITINGQKVGQAPEQDAKLLRDISSTGTARIQVQRGESTVTITQSISSF